MSKDIEVKVLDGGRLVTAFSTENVGPNNWTRKLNFRRQKDQEIRREGWILFKPNAAGANSQATFDGTETVLRLAELVRPNGERVVVGASRTKIKKFDTTTGLWATIGSGYSASGLRWQAVTMNGYLVLNNGVDLMVTYRVEDATVTPIYEMREVGIASAKRITEFNGFLFIGNVTEIKADQLDAWMNGLTPWGIPGAGITNVIPYELANSEFGEPRKWAPSFSIVMAASSATITLPFVSTVFIANVTRVAVVNGGPDGDVLGGDTEHPDGILVTAVVGNVLTLEVPTDASIGYPRTVEVMRWTDLNTIVGRYLLQGDGSEITGLMPLQNLLCVYRTKGIYTGRYTGDVDTPFVFTPRYAGINVPKWGDAIANVNGDYHLYPGTGNRFYKFDGASWPSIHAVADDAANLFFASVVDTDACFAVDNPITKEWWFCNPYLVFAFDYDTPGGTVSEIDAVIAAAAFAQRPSSTDNWFILAVGATVFTYGLVIDAIVPIHTWLRNAVVPSARLKSGLISLGDQSNEKDLLNYTPIMSSSSADPLLEIQLYATRDPSIAPAALLAPVAELPDPDGNNFLTTLFRAIYFQDEIVITDDRDIDARLSARLFEFDRTDAGGVNRQTGG